MYAGQGGQQRRFIGVVGEQQLDLVEAVALPPAEADQEGDGPGGRREPGRLGVETDERHTRRRLPGQGGQADPIERDLARFGRAADDEPAGQGDHLATDGPGQSLGQDASIDRGVGQLDLAGASSGVPAPPWVVAR